MASPTKWHACGAGAPAAFALHEYVSLLGLAFAVFHAVIILGDHYINFTLLQLFVPFSTVEYRPFWVGMGQLWHFIHGRFSALTFYIRPIIGNTEIVANLTLRQLRNVLDGNFPRLVQRHNDRPARAGQNYYWISAGSLLFLLTYRILCRGDR